MWPNVLSLPRGLAFGPPARSLAAVAFVVYEGVALRRYDPFATHAGERLFEIARHS
jgi:hypothetical protein